MHMHMEHLLLVVIEWSVKYFHNFLPMQQITQKSKSGSTLKDIKLKESMQNTSYMHKVPFQVPMPPLLNPEATNPRHRHQSGWQVLGKTWDNSVWLQNSIVQAHG